MSQVGMPRSYLQLPQVGRNQNTFPPVTYPQAVPPWPVIITGPPFPPLVSGTLYGVDTSQTAATLTLPALALGGSIWVQDVGYNAVNNPIVINALGSDQIALFDGLQPYVKINTNDGGFWLLALPGQHWRALPPLVM
jgi:hypothetical protein